MKILMIIALMTPVMSVQAGSVSREYLHLEQRRERAAQEARFRETERDRLHEQRQGVQTPEADRLPGSKPGC